MKRIAMFVLVAAAVSFGQKATAVSKTAVDTLIPSKQVTMPAKVIRPSERVVIDSVMVNDSIRVMCYKNGKEIVKWVYVNKRAVLDEQNITKGVLSVYFEDFSK